MKRRQGLEIWKFGGASLADARAVRRAVELIHSRSGPLIVVVSALGGVTDALLEGARRSAAGDPRAGGRTAAAFLRRHRELVHQLLRPGPGRRRLLARLDQAAREYRELARAVTALRNLSPRASDMLVARGEAAAAAIMAVLLSDSGRRAAFVDALEVVATDGRHGAATPDLSSTRVRCRRRVRPILSRGATPVVPGFQGAAPDGSLTTLGRGGSDLTATLLGRALGARRVVLWKDVPGILTADPRNVADARLIPQLHRREAAEVAYFGAKVLHPRALIPLEGSRIVCDVRSFVHPERPGTEISSRSAPRGHPVKALATVGGQALVTVAGKGMMGVPGIAARTFHAVHAADLSVSTIFQASSESSIGFTLPEADSAAARHALRRALKEELASGLIDDVTSRSGVSVIAVVGNGMAGTPGIAARVFSALAAGGVNVIAIAQGSSERNITFVVSSPDAPEAARRVHGAFQLSKHGGGSPLPTDGTDVVLLGFGGVGCALARQIASGDRGQGLRVVALLDRSGCVFDTAGVSTRRLRELAARKAQGASLVGLGGLPISSREALDLVSAHAVSRPVLVDVTAEDTTELLLEALAHGFDLVLANKRPLAGSRRDYRRLVSAAAALGRRIRLEATVGAGLPILDTQQKLVEAGDRILRIEGCVSGTLGYVLSAVSEGRPFSKALGEAMERGYCEPDPREDLSGRDAARKGLILARLLGYTGPAPRAESLVPERLRPLPRVRFLERLPSLDRAWQSRVSALAARGKVPRYVVRVSATRVEAGLRAVDRSSLLGSLEGTRNLVLFKTRRYNAEPLVISGPGAGVELTASGILNDLLALARG